MKFMKEVLTMYPYNPIDGNYLTRRFKEIFSSTEEFITEFRASDLNLEELTDSSLKYIYALLYAKYGNSCIASYDETQFKYGVWSRIFTHGPSWFRRLEVQAELRKLSIDDLQLGAKAVYNTALNPSSAPSTNTTEELTYINQQNTTKYKKSKLEAYAGLEELLKTDITESFISGFNKLFITIVQPDRPLWYITTPEEQMIIDGE